MPFFRFPHFAGLIFLAFLGVACSPAPTPDRRMIAPIALADAADEAGAARVFWNPSARQVLTAAGRKVPPAGPEDYTALDDPSFWRRLDRRNRFDAVALAGQPSEYAALLGHLRDSPDFRLAHLDNWGVLFLRGKPEPFQPPEVTQTATDLDNAEERSAYLAGMAVVLDAAGHAGAARDFLATARDLAPQSADVRTRAAYLALQNLRFREAIDTADETLALDRKNVPALQIKAQALAASGRIDAAWIAAEQFKELADPGDMNALFLHAQIANAARAFSREQNSLERLVLLAEQAGIPATDYRVYLGQCYAKQGKPQPALDQLKAALGETGLSETQRADIENAVRTITARAGVTP